MPDTILKKPRNWSHLAWLFPLMAAILIGALLYFAQQSREKRGDSDLARQLVRDRIERAFSPLRLTAAHFGTVSPGIPVPPETVLRHFRFLQETGDFTDLAMVSHRQQVVAFLGGDADALAATVRQRTPGASYLHLSTRAGELDGLILGVPLTPTGDDPQWIVARYPVARLLAGLPTFLRVGVAEKPVAPPVHVLAPLLSVGLAAHERPVWPLVLGELMLFAGLLLLVLAPSRGGQPRPTPPERRPHESMDTL
jgi:hypothetical protein